VNKRSQWQGLHHAHNHLTPAHRANHILTLPLLKIPNKGKRKPRSGKEQSRRLFQQSKSIPASPRQCSLATESFPDPTSNRGFPSYHYSYRRRASNGRRRQGPAFRGPPQPRAPHPNHQSPGTTATTNTADNQQWRQRYNSARHTDPQSCPQHPLLHLPHKRLLRILPDPDPERLNPPLPSPLVLGAPAFLSSVSPDNLILGPSARQRNRYSGLGTGPAAAEKRVTSEFVPSTGFERRERSLSSNLSGRTSTSSDGLRREEVHASRSRTSSVGDEVFVRLTTRKHPVDSRISSIGGRRRMSGFVILFDTSR